VIRHDDSVGLVLRHAQQILAAPGGANVITLVPNPPRPPNPTRSSLEVGTSNRRSSPLICVLPVAAMAQGSPFDTGFNAIQALFTGTIAKVASLVAIVIGGYGFAHGEPGAKKALAGVAAGTGIAVLAVNVLSWLWGV
jgi:type IV secretory pathway VirB2 component (pilin)